MKEFKVLYFKYNACKEMEDKSVFDFGKELIKFINKNQVDKLVIDLRNNSGGNSTLLEPFIEDLKACDKINKKGNLFVIVGRETFSSALLNVLLLKEDTNAIFLGEATGGKPNCYGEVERFTLKNSGLTVCYSTKYYKIIKDDSLPSFYPEVSLALTIENYIKNEDPFLDYVLKFK
nr:S41 family peptidase [Clostridium aciditolerans]